MRHRSLWAAFAAFVLLLAPGPKASAATSFSFSLRVGDPYIGPSLAFYEQPDVVVIPGTRVYYVEDYDYDLYRYGSYWYYCWNGGWYRSLDYDGPFYFIGYQSVPYAIRYVPVHYRHHWRSYRGAAYANYSAGRYYPSNQSSYTYYRTRYENRTNDRRFRGQYSVQQNRYRQRQQPVQYRQERAPQREQVRQQTVQERRQFRQQRAREQVRQQQPPQREQVRQRDQGRQRQQESQGRQNQGKRGKGNQRGQDENRGQGNGNGRGHGN